MSTKSVLNSSIMSNVIAGLIVAGVLWYVGKKAAGGASDAISGAVQSAKDFGSDIGNSVYSGSNMLSAPWSPNYALLEAQARFDTEYWNFMKGLSQAARNAQTATSITSEGTVQ
jgi:hypothetical protein